MVSKLKTLLFLSTLYFSLFCFNNALFSLQTYIVQLHPQSEAAPSYPSRLHWHLSFLEKTMSSTLSFEDNFSPSDRLLYSYSSAMEGFSALLSEPEVEFLRGLHDVIAVRPDRRLEVHTTYSYKFLGLDIPRVGAWCRTGFGKGTIIGVLDTGVWPESPSFSDQGMSAPPRKWRGICQEGQNFNASNCNKKLIGARFFIKGHHVANAQLISPEFSPEYVSPRDSSGHGTHTSSTAGGSAIQMASVLGNGAGKAQGMAPGAHVAIYKVCWFGGCYSSDILAAMDVAIRDGVDVLSLSLGGIPIPFYDDTVAIGSFHAAEKGISVICAAGNNGPVKNSVANEAPWVTTVGASTLDRRFPAYVQTGSGKYIYGESMFPGNHFPGAEKELEVVYITGGDTGSEYCLEGSLSRAQVAGKMVVCDRGVNGRAEKGEVVKRVGGAAMILANTEKTLIEDSVDAHVLPATLIGYSESIQLKSYIKSTKRATARIRFFGTVEGRSRAPAVARFSSRGPSLNNPSILKPDMIAPGVNIIAAWPQNLGPSGLLGDSRRGNFTVLSGTSMSCPHVSGIAALIYSAHPNWSPAAVKSAMMTTADVTDHYGKPILDGNILADHNAIGSGHINPAKAIDPGLVYDIKPADYITHLCNLGYTSSDIFAISHRNTSCKEILQQNRGFSLNYPSISAVLKGKETVQVINRKVTNVGRPNSIYSVEVRAPEGIRIIVKPKRLVFRNIYQTLGYKVYVVAENGAKAGSFAQGELVWMHSQRNLYKVRSPITVSWVSKKS